MIGSINDILFCNKIEILPKGHLLVKNMNVPAILKNVYDKFLNSGFELYCHEQEPAILWSDFNKYIDTYNIALDQFLPFKRVFCWGERDYMGYRKLFSKQREVFQLSGSPRVDLWRPELNLLWQRDDIQRMKPYVLFVSNNGFAIGKRHWSEFIEIARTYEVFKTDEIEKDHYLNMQKDVLMIQNVVFSLRKLSEKYPDVNFIIRPHPLDNVRYWQSAIGQYENIHVLYRDSLSPWIAGAKAVIHNSCSSAIEAAIQGVPVISYVPSDLCDMLDIPNKLGTLATNHQELEAAVDRALTESDVKVMTNASHTVLDPLLAIDKELASHKIVELIEQATEIKSIDKISSVNFLKIRLALRAKVILDKARGIYLHDGDNLFDRNDVQRQITKISETLGLPKPKVRFVSNTTILIG
jgi:surface carbohydrate biosynthesis protein